MRTPLLLLWVVVALAVILPVVRAQRSRGQSQAPGERLEGNVTAARQNPPASTDGDRSNRRFGGNGKKNTARPRFRAGSTA
ncbi:hypothetical protein MRX96_012965 [Rhipicephalus microplus]